MREKKSGTPPTPALCYIWAHKGGHFQFSQKGLSYGFEILHGLLSYQMIRIPTKKIIRGPLLPPALCYMWADKGGYFQKVVVGFQNFGYDF